MTGRLALRPAVVIASILAVTILSGCTAYSGTPAHKVKQWASHSSFVSDNTTLVNDASRVRDAVTLGTPEQMRTICGGFAYDVGTTYDTLPTPDVVLTNDLNAADISLLSASTACSSVGTLTSPKMKEALVQLDAGLGELARAQRRLESFGVSWDVRV